MRLGIDASNIRGGGGITHLGRLLHSAHPDEHGISQVIVWGGRNTLNALPTSSWIRLIHEPSLDGRLPSRLYWQRTQLDQRARADCDVLFIPGGSYFGLFRPFVAMSQNMLPFDTRERRRYGTSWMFLRMLLLEQAQASTFRRCDGLIFLTRYAQSTVLRLIGKRTGQCALVPHGVDARFLRAPVKQRPLSAYSSGKPFRLLYVSTVDVYKHQCNVAEAVTRMRTAGFPVELELVGGAYPSALRRLQDTMRALDPEQQFIRYWGAVPYSELEKYYHRADTFIFASTCENMPNILLEAMASGLPIACSDRGPMPEILAGAGVYFDPENLDGIAGAIESLLNNPDLREQKAWDAYRCAQAYSWERTAAQTFSFLNDIRRRSQGEIRD